MPESCAHLYVHLVWATWDRQPFIQGATRRQLYAVMTEECRKMRCLPMAIGGTEDHVHILVRLHADTAVSSLVHRIKGVSSHLARQSWPEFRWQGSYGAFSLGPSDVERVRAYVEHQEEHHAAGTLWPRAERCSAESATEVDHADASLYDTTEETQNLD